MERWKRVYTFFAVLASLILTCLTNPEHNEYTEFQVDDGVLFAGGALSFTDADGDRYTVSETACTIFEGTVKEPGADMRNDRPPRVNCD